MTYLSRTSKTRKRSSEDRWGISIVILGLFIVLIVLVYGIRAVTIAGVYGTVGGELPVVATAIEDPSYHRFREEPRDSLTAHTPAVVLTTDAFYFGDLAAFSTDFAAVNNKYSIAHIDGEPQLATLVTSMDSWVGERAKSENRPINRLLVLIPEGEIPVPIIIQVMAGLKQSQHFGRIVLASGVL